MKNILSREEFLNQQMNEGFVDSVKKGFNKVKNFFRMGIRKIKNLIVVFGSNGKVLPVITPAAVIDHCAGSNAIQVYAPQELQDFVKKVGGKTDGLTTMSKEPEEIDDNTPDGLDYAKYCADEKFKDTVEFKNYTTLLNFLNGLNESNNSSDGEELNETWQDSVKKRVSYKASTEEGLRELDVLNFEQLQQKILWQLNHRPKNFKEVGDKKLAPVLIFGASGIGKSSIFNTVVDIYNKSQKSNSNKISVIRVNCESLDADSWFMPSLPRDTDVLEYIRSHPDLLPKSNAMLDKGYANTSSREYEILTQRFNKLKPLSSVTYIRPSWLPSYNSNEMTDMEELLDENANRSIDTGGGKVDTADGGIIIFDEFLRVQDKSIFDKFMNLISDRQAQGWRVGSRWLMCFCSNRPEDDETSAEGWTNLQKNGSLRNRLDMLQLEPDPETWKKWARKKGCDEMILDFIFEDVSENPDRKNSRGEDETVDMMNVNKIGGEYARWHTITNSNEMNLQGTTVSPRKWEEFFNLINLWKIDNKKYSIAQMSKDDYNIITSGKFDKEFRDLIYEWIQKKKNSVSLESIINSPKSTYFPSSVKDETDSIEVLKDLTKQFEKMFHIKDDEHPNALGPEECTDEKLTNIFYWLGKHYISGGQRVHDYFVNELEDAALEKGSANRISAHQNACYMLYAAFPPEPDPDLGTETVEDNIRHDFVEDIFKDPDAVEKIQKLAKKHFPWNWDKEKKCLIRFDGVTEDKIEKYAQ